MLHGWKPIEFTSLELRMLEILIRNNHVLVTVDDLIEHAWGDQPELVSPPVRIHIANIRKKIGDTNYKSLEQSQGLAIYSNDPIQKERNVIMDKLLKQTRSVSSPHNLGRMFRRRIKLGYSSAIYLSRDWITSKHERASSYCNT